MNRIKLDKYEIDFLTESFPLAIGDVKGILVNDFNLTFNEAIQEGTRILKRFYELGFITFHIWLFYKDNEKLKIILTEPENGYELKANDKFWNSLKTENEIWNRLTDENQDRNWDVGINLSEEFYEKYCTPDNTEFYKLINQE